MNWVQLIIPLIALAVWIIASIIGTVQQQQQRAPRRNIPRPPQREPESHSTAEEDALKPSPEMERKLEEAKRRRKALAEKQQEVERRRQSESDQARRRASPGEEPARPPVAAPEPVRPRERRSEQAPAAPVPTATIVRDRSAPRPMPVREQPGKSASHSSSENGLSTLSLAQALGPAAHVKRNAPSPVATEVARLLKDPTSLAAAFMLREVFDPPVAMRKRK